MRLNVSVFGLRLRRFIRVSGLREAPRRYAAGFGIEGFRDWVFREPKFETRTPGPGSQSLNRLPTRHPGPRPEAPKPQDLCSCVSCGPKSQIQGG